MATDRGAAMIESTTERVEQALKHAGGGVRVIELAYQTGLDELEVIDALYDLEQQGRATPWAWMLGPEAT